MALHATEGQAVEGAIISYPTTRMPYRPIGELALWFMEYGKSKAICVASRYRV